jgi:hypothetical protein
VLSSEFNNGLEAAAVQVGRVHYGLLQMTVLKAYENKVSDIRTEHNFCIFMGK